MAYKYAQAFEIAIMNEMMESRRHESREGQIYRLQFMAGSVLNQYTGLGAIYLPLIDWWI